MTPLRVGEAQVALDARHAAVHAGHNVEHPVKRLRVLRQRAAVIGENGGDPLKRLRVARKDALMSVKAGVDPIKARVDPIKARVDGRELSVMIVELDANAAQKLKDKVVGLIGHAAILSRAGRRGKLPPENSAARTGACREF
jgi:hypothetical protein